MKNPKQWLQKNIIGFGLASFFNDCSHEMVNVLLPTFIQQLIGTSHAAVVIGIISGISDAVASSVRIWSGLMVDRIQRYKLFLIIGYTLTPLFSGLIGTAQSLWHVLVYRMLAWTGKGLREPVRDTWLTRLVPSSHYGQTFGFVRALDTLGAIAGPCIVFFILHHVPLRTLFFISFIPGVFSVLAIILLTQEPQKNAIIRPFVSFKSHLKDIPNDFNYFVGIMFIFGIGNFNKLLIVYRAQEAFTGAASSFIATTGWAIMLYTLFNGIRALSEYTIGTLSDYVNRKNLLALFGYGFFALANLGLMLPHSSSMTLWILIFITAGISAGTISSLPRAYAAQLLPEATRGIGFAILQTCDGIGDLISSIVVGALWTYWAPHYGFIYAALLSMLAMVALIVSKPHQHQPTPSLPPTEPL